MKTVSRTAAALALAVPALVLQAPAASALSCADPSGWYPDLVLGPCSLASVDGSAYGVAGADSPRPPVAAGETGVEIGVGPDVAEAAATGLEPPPEKSSVAPLAAGGAGVVGAGALAALLWRRRRAA